MRNTATDCASRFFNSRPTPGISDSEALADALIVLYDGALATTGTAELARSAAMTAKRIARLTLAAARAVSSA